MRGPDIGDGLRVSATTKHIAIDVRVDGEEISGHAREDSGECTPFSGWLGLLGALDGLISLTMPEEGTDGT